MARHIYFLLDAINVHVIWQRILANVTFSFLQILHFFFPVAEKIVF